MTTNRYAFRTRVSAEQGRRIRMNLPIPRLENLLECRRREGKTGQRTPEATQRLPGPAERQAWPALLLTVRTKLKAVESGVTTVAEKELLAHRRNHRQDSPTPTGRGHAGRG